MTPGNFEKFLPRLSTFGVRFVLIGGGAAIAHGLAKATYDVDVVYDRSLPNLERLVNALKEVNLYYRGAPAGLPFRFDVSTLQAGLNFTFTSDWGDFDLLGEVPGDGTYLKLLPFCETLELYGNAVLVVSLDKLIALKRAAGRPKDFETVAQLEALKEERGE